jgi:serine/threonine protein kinase
MYIYTKNPSYYQKKNAIGVPGQPALQPMLLLREEKTAISLASSYDIKKKQVFLDDPHYSSSIDIYSASLIFWFMATGLHPFSVIPPRSVAVAAAMAHARPATHLIDSKYVSANIFFFV